MEVLLQALNAKQHEAKSQPRPQPQPPAPTTNTKGGGGPSTPRSGQEAMIKRSAQMHHTPKNIIAESTPAAGYDMRPWWEKQKNPQPYIMADVGMPDYKHWTEIVADYITQKHEEGGVMLEHALPDFEGWEQQKEKKVRVALQRIIDRKWYSPDEHKLSDEELRHRNALREHYSMCRNKLMTPAIGANTMPHHEWHSNMNALSVLSKDTNVQNKFRKQVERVHARRNPQKRTN
eukprot:PhF_6_TR19137/c0_g1_i1/m.28152